MKSGSAKEIWETALGELELQISKANYRTWLDKTVGLSCSESEFVIGVPNTFVAEYLDKNQRSMIEKTLIGLLEKPVTVTFGLVSSQQPSGSFFGGSKPLVPAGAGHLNAQYTFDSFIVSNANRMAYAAALGASENPGLRAYNPLFIYGGVGLGKTHLLHAMGHVAQGTNRNVFYLSAEQFTTEFVCAIRERKADDFRSKYQSADMLLVDDIQFLGGKEQTEETFFHIFNELHNNNRQIAVTCNQLPKSIPQMDDRLRSRFEWGLTTSVQPPDFETRLSILQAKIGSEGVEVPQQVLNLIAEKIKRNIRELEGALNRVTAYARLLGTAITPDLAREAMEDIGSRQPRIPLTPPLLLDTVATRFQVPVFDLKSKKRDKQTTLARQVAMYLLRSEISCSLSQVGKELGDREAITVSQACKKIADEIQQNPELKKKVLDIQQEIRQKAMNS